MSPQVIPDGIRQSSESMAAHQEAHGIRLAERRERRRRAQARLLLETSDLGSAVAERISEQSITAGPSCIICQEPYEEGDLIAVLQCDHSYHMTCIDEWVATRSQANRATNCPHLSTTDQHYRTATSPSRATNSPTTTDRTRGIRHSLVKRVRLQHRDK